MCWCMGVCVAYITILDVKAINLYVYIVYFYNGKSGKDIVLQQR